MDIDRFRLSRRACLIGAAGAAAGTALAACGGSGRAPNATLIGAVAAEHWSVRYTGVAPDAMFVHRGPLWTPGYLFRGRWLESRFVCDLFDTRRAARQVELFSYPKLNDLYVFRGMGATPPPRGGGCFDLVGQAPSGAVQYAGQVYGQMRLFTLPDGTWVGGDAPALERLGSALATSATPPPSCDLEPGASVAQQDVGHDALKVARLIPDGLVARDAVVARTVALFPGPPRARRLTVRFSYASSSQASSAATSLGGLLRSGAARDQAWSAPSDDLARFMRSVTDVQADGENLVLVGSC